MNADSNDQEANFAKFSIEDALNYQKANNMSLEDFITNVANKIKF